MKVKAPIAPEAVVKRLNRRLETNGQSLKVARGLSLVEQVGDYFLVEGDSIRRCNVDLEKLAREKGALREYEVVGL
jgi:hypothetical protein